MAEYRIKLPPGPQPNASHAAILLTSIDVAEANNSQPTEVAEPVPGTSRATTTHDAQTESMKGFTDDAHRGISHDPTGTDNGILFWPFKHLPGEIRTMIWMAAAANAKPRGVYQFKFKVIRLARDRYQLPQSIFTNIRQLQDDSPAVLDVRTLVQGIYDGDVVSTFTPLPEVAKFTREMRDLLRSCPEARSELMRDRDFSSSFSFHWVRGGMCDLGVVRPFCYDTDWISFSGLTRHPSWPARRILPAAPGVLCTPDIAAIQHVAISYSECHPAKDYWNRDAQVRGLGVFPSLKSFGMYEPSFCVKRVPHWDRLITQEQKLFLKGVSTSVPATASGRRLTGRVFRDAMWHLNVLMHEVSKEENNNKRAGQHSAYPSPAGLNFCFLLHANSQAGLDLMKFKEDGSHLGNLAQIEDLGDLGRRVKALQNNGSKAI